MTTHNNEANSQDICTTNEDEATVPRDTARDTNHGSAENPELAASKTTSKPNTRVHQGCGDCIRFIENCMISMDFALGMDRLSLNDVKSHFVNFARSLSSVSLAAMVCTIANVALALARNELVNTIPVSVGLNVTGLEDGETPNVNQGAARVLLTMTSLVSLTTGVTEGTQTTVQALIAGVFAGVLSALQLAASHGLENGTVDGVIMIMMLLFFILLTRRTKISIWVQCTIVDACNVYLVKVYAVDEYDANPLIIIPSALLLALSLLLVAFSICLHCFDSSRYFVVEGNNGLTVASFRRWRLLNFALIVFLVNLTAFSTLVCSIFMLLERELLERFEVFLGPAVTMTSRSAIVTKEAGKIMHLMHLYYDAVKSRFAAPRDGNCIAPFIEGRLGCEDRNYVKEVFGVYVEQGKEAAQHFIDVV